MGKERLSVHVCTANRATEIAVLLSSLRNQTFKDWDLIILDDQSNTPVDKHYFNYNLIRRIMHEGHGVKILRNDLSKGIGYARNQCCKKDRWNELIVRIDDDSFLEKDYLEKLYKIATGEIKHGKIKVKYSENQLNFQTKKLPKPEEIGGVGGIVPVAGAPETKLSTNSLGGVFNKISYDEKGNIFLSDDGGYSWTPNKILPSHHLRSSFLFRKSAWKRVGGYPDHLGTVSFREETIFSIKLLYAGYALLTDTSAKCWHSRCAQGGCRTPQYMDDAKAGHEWFTKWAKRQWLDKGVPWKHEVYGGKV